ncbi:hypothetical protein E2C01_025601 [Portunus trituberculatus]|uniref:Uncharacterized protein n=1 Tax=Portunus trituberculatus TaxID=210409 RepID=A0A5B7EDQ5_PORTR|nr:hypothetical protein [Portunus trituberculatus]
MQAEEVVSEADRLTFAARSCWPSDGGKGWVLAAVHLPLSASLYSTGHARQIMGPFEPRGHKFCSGLRYSWRDAKCGRGRVTARYL